MKKKEGRQTERQTPAAQNQNNRRFRKEERGMKGYVTYDGYMGYINGGYMLFASESDYEEYVEG